VANNLKRYQLAGTIQFDLILSIPLSDRLPGLVKQYGDKKIHILLVAMLTDFCNYFNVVRQMNSDQIVQCAYELIITAEEDQLSIEDLALFFQGAKQGKYNTHNTKIFDHIDQALIFELLEVYRQQRHEQYFRIKEEKESQYKVLGPSSRLLDELNPMDAKMQKDVDTLAGQMNELKTKLKEW
jgi:hypothetical protein